ncbi:hypothetical protein EV424DRAFT_159710 [Suillus variegatus]|nr:hypothetical protein EV424DRAFT_159710 [Suillus variegatus]
MRSNLSLILEELRYLITNPYNSRLLLTTLWGKNELEIPDLTPYCRCSPSGRSCGSVSLCHLSGCIGLVVTCYAGAGFTLVVAPPLAGPAVIACNVAFGGCTLACAALVFAPTP